MEMPSWQVIGQVVCLLVGLAGLTWVAVWTMGNANVMDDNEMPE